MPAHPQASSATRRIAAMRAACSACVLCDAFDEIHAQEGAAYDRRRCAGCCREGHPRSCRIGEKRFERRSQMVATDQEGKFSVSGLGEGTYSVEASAPSFTTAAARA